jgi:pilus assembly protein Flp/PilA
MMAIFLSRLANFVGEDSGSTAVEYALIALLVSVSIVGSATVIGGKLDATFTFLSTLFP